MLLNCLNWNKICLNPDSLISNRLFLALESFLRRVKQNKGGIIMEEVLSSRDVLLLGLNAGLSSIHLVLDDVTAEEYNWEPIPLSERPRDQLLPAEKKKVWRVFQRAEKWIYDYTPEVVEPPPFTTIAWIMNHTAQTAGMYLYCITSGKPEGVERRWEDLPVPASFNEMRAYICSALAEGGAYLSSLSSEKINQELNRETPAPWGEMRPTYLNLWGGVIEHVIQHAM
jgi:hypothetical protein